MIPLLCSLTLRHHRKFCIVSAPCALFQSKSPRKDASSKFQEDIYYIICRSFSVVHFWSQTPKACLLMCSEALEREIACVSPGVLGRPYLRRGLIFVELHRTQDIYYCGV